LRLRRSGRNLHLSQFASDPVWTERLQQIDLGLAGDRVAPIGQVDDLALARAVDRGVWLFEKTLQAFRQPMVSARLPTLAIHSLLHDDPSAVIRHDKPVKVKIEAVLHQRGCRPWRRACWLWPARRRQTRPARRWRPARTASAAAAADMDAQFAPSGARPRFSAPITLVVMPDERQSIPITAPNAMISEAIVHHPSRVIRSASHFGTCPPCSGRSAIPALRAIVY
jgi:hypothetical protein